MNINKICTVDYKASDDSKEDEVTATISTTEADRDGDVVLPSGLDAKAYKSNPVVLLQHDINRPIGKATKLRTTSSEILASMKFATRPVTLPSSVEWIPDTIKSLMQEGILSAFSIGFRVPQGGYRDATAKDINKFGSSTRRVITKWELVEFSVVSVPSNANALAIAVSKGFVPDGDGVRALGLSSDLLSGVGEVKEVENINRRLRIKSRLVIK